MNKLAVIGAFVSGAAVGAVATWYLVKTKYEQYAQEEIDSVKEAYGINRNDELDEDLEREIENIAKEKVEDILQNEGYTNYSVTKSMERKQEQEKEEVEDLEKPYVISPDEYDEIGYNTVSLTLYADGILVEDVTDEVVENIDEIVGVESLKTFGQYEKDSVFVRNDKLQTDYEILLDTSNYLNPDEDDE